MLTHLNGAQNPPLTAGEFSILRPIIILQGGVECTFCTLFSRQAADLENGVLATAETESRMVSESERASWPVCVLVGYTQDVTAYHGIHL
jgi:hypothetical protein